MSKKSRLLKRSLGVLLVLVVVLTLVASFALGPIIKTAAENIGPKVVGVPLTVESVQVFPWTGSVRLKGLVVGPPEGYAANLAELNSFSMTMQIRSLFSDTIVIRQIAIKGPEVTYELSGLKSNIGALLAGLESGEKVEKPDEKEPDKEGGKKVIIEHFLFADGKVRLATTLTGGKGVVLPLPKVEMHDIGRKKEGVTTLSAIRQTTAAVSVAILTTVADGVVGIADLGVDATKLIVGTAGEGLKLAGDITGKALSLVGDGVEAAADLAVDGVKAVGDLATDGVRAVGGVLKSVGNLVSGSDEKTVASPETKSDKKSDKKTKK